MMLPFRATFQPDPSNHHLSSGITTSQARERHTVQDMFGENWVVPVGKLNSYFIITPK